jgi:hypothetical protein
MAVPAGLIAKKTQINLQRMDGFANKLKMIFDQSCREWRDLYHLLP